MMRILLVLFCICLSISVATPQSKLPPQGNGPDCGGGWPTNMAFGAMKNAGLLTNADLDFTKTQTKRIASERIAKDLWHQVYLVTFRKKSGESLEVIAVHNASTDECSMSGVEVYVVGKHLGGN